MPAPMDRITVAAPVTASPPAYTPSRLVSPPSSSVMMQPRLLVSSPGVVLRISGLGLVPMATITASTSISKAESFTGTGRRRPLSSGSPSSIAMQRRPHTKPFSSPSTSMGSDRVLKAMPSSWACSTSSLRAGSSFIERR